MKKTLKKILPISLLCIHSLSFSATAISGPYMRVFGGYAFTPSNVYTNSISDLNYNHGYDTGAQIGYKSGPIRYEFEGAFVYNKLKNLPFY